MQPTGRHAPVRKRGTLTGLKLVNFKTRRGENNESLAGGGRDGAQALIKVLEKNTGRL